MTRYQIAKGEQPAEDIYGEGLAVKWLKEHYMSKDQEKFRQMWLDSWWKIHKMKLNTIK